jgi:UDP-2-acetamido-2,6-beta-L-arabino-hexul-4-ose reductase
MIKIGITGQSGFIGTHLFNTLGLYPTKYQRVSFEDSFFVDELKLKQFVSSCDVIVHLAALNRHNDPHELYKINILLVKKLLSACEISGSNPHFIFSSSIQEEKNNEYGRSKRDCRELFEKWAKNNGSGFTGMIIPNVFGPFAKPYYNTVVATFCHQLVHNETPRIEVDSELKLIYVAELIKHILAKIDTLEGGFKIQSETIDHTATIKVSELLKKLKSMTFDYLKSGIIPNLNSTFDLNLYNTMLTCIDYRSVFPFKLHQNTDVRGCFVEIMKLNSVGQVSFSSTKPEITRGNHFHTRKAERFAVIKGQARIELRKIGSDQKYEFILGGEKPSFVDMPVWHTHNITNIGDDELFTIFWINENFEKSDPDTYFELV